MLKRLKGNLNNNKNNFFNKFSNVKINNKVNGNAKINLKLVIVFFIGVLFFGGSVFAATVISSSEVSYTSNGQSTVKDAIDDLYSISSSWINPNYINFGSLDTTAGQTVLASSDGVCIKRNNKVSCFKTNNYNVEKDHVQEVFSDGTCTTDSYGSVECNTSDFYCRINPSGTLGCTDKSVDSGCNVNGSNGKVDCTKALDGNSIDFSTVHTNTAKTVLASSKGVCINRNGMLHCFKINNYNFEKSHIQKVFSDGTCGFGEESGSEYIMCISTNYQCYIYSNGSVNCYDRSDLTRKCKVSSDASISCQ